MGYTFLGESTLTSAADSISVTVAAKRYLMIHIFFIPISTVDCLLRFNGDSGNNYAYRKSFDYAADLTTASTSGIDLVGNTFSSATHVTVELVNKSDKEKLAIIHSIVENSPGSAPDPAQIVGKWVNTSAQITSLSLNNTQAGDFDVGTRMYVFGSD